MSLNPNDTLVALSNGTFWLAQIVPSFIWAFTKNTLFYAYNNPDSNNFTIIYYNYKTDEKHTHTMSNVIAVSGHSETFVIASKGQLNDTTIHVTDTIGVLIAKIIILYVPTCIAVYENTIAICA